MIKPSLKKFCLDYLKRELDKELKTIKTLTYFKPVSKLFVGEGSELVPIVLLKLPRNPAIFMGIKISPEAGVQLIRLTPQNAIKLGRELAKLGESVK